MMTWHVFSYYNTKGVTPDSGLDSAVSPVSESSQCVEIRMKGVMAILAHGAIKKECVARLDTCLAPLGLSVHAWGVLGEPLTHLCT
jgi:hypothetical protein